MSKRLIWFGAIAIVLVLLGAGAAVAGFFLYRDYEDQRNLAAAEQYFADGEWSLAINHYRFYLSRNREDVAVLRKFAAANENVLARRRDSLKAAAGAYHVINALEPDPDLQDKMLEIYRRIRSWSDLEYYAQLFLRDRPDDAGLTFLEALAMDRQGRAEDARNAYEALIEAGTDNPEVYGNLAALLSRMGFREQAREVAGALEQDLPDLADTYLALADFHYNLNGFDESQAYLDKALALDSELTPALFLQAQLHLMNDRPQEALAAAERALALAPDSARTHLLKAVALNRLNDRNGAIETLEAVDDTTAVDNPEVLLALAESQISANRLADVERAMNLYRTAYPEMRLTHEYLEGRKALAEGNAALAVTKLTNVVEMNPAFASAQYYMAVALLQSQQRDRGRTALESYLRNNPNDTQAQKLFRAEFGGPQSVAEAEQQTQRLLETSENVEELFGSIRPLLDNQDPQEGRPVFNPIVVDVLGRILTLEPDNPRALQSLIFYHAEFGDASKARDALRRAEEAGVGADRLLMARAAVDVVEGNVQAATEAFAAALERQDFTVDKAMTWGNLFATHGHVEEGLAVLTQAAERNVGGAAAVIELEKPRLLVRHGQLDRAIQTLDELALKYDTTTSAREPILDLRLQLAETLLNMPEPGRQQQGEQLLAQIEQTGPGNADVLLIRARHLLRQQPPKTEEAITLLDRVLAVDKNNFSALMLLAQIHANQASGEQALNYARRAADVSAGSLDAQLLVARLQFQLERHRECQETLESLLASHPKSVPAMEMLVESYLTTGRTQLAQTILQDLRELASPDEGGATRFNLLQSRLLVAQGRDLGEAEHLLERQYEADPENVAVVSDLARAVAAQGRPDEAAALLSKFADSHATNPEAWHALGRFYLEQEAGTMMAKASSALTRALMLDANYVPALRSQIELQSRQGKPVETLQLADRYLETRPKDDAVLFRKAIVLYQLGRMEEALEVIERALAVTDRPEYLYLRASVRLAQENFQEALQDLQKVAPQGFSTANFDMALAEAYWGVGETDLAVQYFESAKRKSVTADPIAPDRLHRFEQRLSEGAAL